MRTLSDVLAAKGTTVFSIGPSETIFDAMEKMNEKGIGALLVMKGNDVAGILSERDVARRITLEGRSAKQTAAGEIMSEQVMCVGPNLDINNAMAIMTDKRVRHLPVLDGDRVVGVVSIGDLVKALIDDQKFTIEQLEQYIKS